MFHRVSKLSLVLLLLSGCQQSDEMSASQVVATVNGEQLTMPQLQAEMTKLSASTKNADTAKKVLTNLIDRQLLAQEAVKLNLDRTPEVTQAIESSKAQIYAQAYMAKKMAKLPEISDEAASEFLRAHPEMFEQRKLFKTVDVTFTHDPAQLDIKAMEQAVTTLSSLEDTLHAKNIVYDKNSSQFLTDRLPLSVLSKVSHLHQGDLMYVHNDHEVIVKSIQDIIDVPTSKSSALLVAKKMLGQQQKQAYIKKEIERLQNLAGIQVFNEKIDSQYH